MYANQDLRLYARSKGVRLYEVAEALGISEPTMTRWLRKELDDSKRAEMIAVIDRVADKHAVQIAATSAQ